ncbi:MAG TPA: helix-turn-helix domain-containing protein [Solirubrobacteraceae bacterium]
MTGAPLARALLAELLAVLRDDEDARAELVALLDSTRRGDDGARLLTPTEAGERLGLHPSTLTRAAKAGRVPGAVKTAGRYWRFPADRLEVLPVAAPDLGPDTPARAPRRPASESRATQAIRNASARRAA